MSAEADAGVLRDTALDREELEHRLTRIWATPRGLWGVLTTVDHKRIGLLYIATAFFFMALGGLSSAIMRHQLATPNRHLVSPDFYDQLFTMHGSTMMFLFAVPVMEGAAVYLVPLMIGTRNVAFPRLNAFSYWVYLFGGLMLWAAFLLNEGPDVGWFDYVPLAGPIYGIGKRPDIWAQMITYTELSALAVAVEIVATTFKMRAPGMTLDRIPLFVWSSLVMAFMILFAMPAVMVCSTMLILDRLLQTHFFDVAAGGDALLFQHLFWFFGHPEVYIIFIPATGMVSAIIPTFTRRPIFGYLLIVLALTGTGILSFGLWVHHMFATGLPRLGESFFTASSIAISIPAGLQIFCWLASLWGGRPQFKTPLLFVLGFLVLFVIGGLTGVMVASVPIDTQVHDTYFVVAHLHYVLIGGAVFPLIGAIFYWFPKVTGRMMDERLGKIQFWLAFISFNLAYFPMHIVGLEGMPRRIYTYGPEMPWASLNLFISLTASLFDFNFVLLLVNMISSYFWGRPAGDNPWDAPTLEWAASSPPPPQNFSRIPVVTAREPLWTERGPLPVVTGLRADRREVLISTVGEAAPDMLESSPQPSIWPFVTAMVVSVVLLVSIFTAWAITAGALPIGIALTLWFWPKGTKEDES